ncbi:hypothetical protein [Brevibacillus parabrevis]|uniref:hypothetical protein n=1 Tax=Brevibacillus parabrevis TaxID=54914 RepID=UPI0028D1A78D|nr:hypothetical protein [Brevibacillus parabrevis]
MNQPKPQAFATFREERGRNYRTSTYIQWGPASVTRSLGSALLLNPGSAALFQARPAAGRSIMGQVTLDRTMQQLVRFTEAIYQNRPLEGRFYIFNLFSLQNPSASDAIACFEQLVKNGETTLEAQLASREELRKQPWIMIGWGCLQRKSWPHFSALKAMWQKQIASASVPAFGKRCSNGQDYYHPCPRLHAMKEPLLRDLVALYQQNVHALPSSFV